MPKVTENTGNNEFVDTPDAVSPVTTPAIPVPQTEMPAPKPSGVNEYDAIAAADSDLGAGNEYDVLAATAHKSQRESLSASMYVGTSQDADRRAKVIQLSNKIGMPPDVVERNFDSLERESRVQGNDYDSIVRDTPGLADWLSKPDNASVAQDDVDNLSETETKVQDFSTAWKALGAFNQGTTRLAAGIARIPNLIGQAAYLPYNLYQRNAGGQEVQYPTSNPVADYLDRQAETFGGVAPELDTSVAREIYNGNYAKAGTAAGYQLMTQIPQVLLALATGGGSALMRGAGLTSLGGAAASDRAKELEQQGVAPSTATPVALASGAIELGTEALGTFRFVEDWSKALVQIAGKDGAREVFQAAGKVLLAGPLTEGTEEAVGQFAQGVMDYATGVDENAIKNLPENVVNNFIGGFLTGGAATGPGTLALSAHQYAKQRQTTAFRAFYESFGDTVKASKLRNRLPEAQRNFVESVTKDGPVENVFIPAEALEKYYQSKDESVIEAMESLGARDAYTEAKETGAPVKIKLSAWASQTVDGDAYQALADDIKFDPGAQTVNELKAETEELQNEVKAAEESATKEAAPTTEEEQRAESGKAVRENVAEQLKAINENPEYAELYRFFEVIGERTGSDPLELFNRYGLKITDESAASAEGESAAQTLEQSLKPRPESELFPVYVNDDLWEIEVDGASLTGQVLGENYEHQLSARGDDVAPKLRKKFDFENVVQIDTVQVDPEKRGTGLASRLVDSFIEEAISQRVDAIILNASPIGTDGLNLKELTAFYKRHGFKVVDKTNVNQTMILDLSDMYYQSDNEGEPLGRITFGKDRQFNIQLLKDANKSTFIHETGHFYVEVMGDVVAGLQALSERTPMQEQVIEDYNNLLEWAGAKPGEKIPVSAHEKIARGFEAYIMEGSAPSSALRRAFARFRLWLVDVYRALSLRVQLTPEVRDIMNRMLATDNEITSAQVEQNQQPLFSDPKFQGMSIEKTKAYLKATEEASEFAKTDINRKLMDHHEKVRSEEYRAERDALIPTITEQADAMQVYQALDKFKNEKLPDGSPFRISYASLSTYGADVTKQMPKGVVGPKKGGGLLVSDAAMMLGYGSEQELITDLTNVVPKQQFINERADAEMAEKFPDLLKSPELDQEVMESIHNQSRAKMLRMELEHLASNNMPVLKEVIRRVTRRVPTEAVVREQARAMIGNKAVGEISPYNYQMAERKAAKEAGVLLAKGDIDGAFEAKRRELLNHELYRAAVEATKSVEKDLESFRKFFRKDETLSKTRDMDMINAARAILYQFGIGSKRFDVAESLRKIKEYDPQAYESVNALILSATEEVGPYETVSFDAFSGMATSVDALWDLAGENKQIEIEGRSISLEEANEAVSSEIRDITGGGKKEKYTKDAGRWEKVKMSLLGSKASLTRVEAWVEAIGPEARRYIWTPVSEATTRYRLRKAPKLKEYEAILQEWGKTQKNPQKIVSDELGHVFDSKMQLMMAVLHSGNESNLSKLLRGRGWGDVDENGVLDTSRWDAFTARLRKEGTLTKEDYDFAQKVWDLMDSLKPDAQKAHKKIHGYFFNEITANSFVNEFGSYRGGYIPAKVDVYSNEDAAIRKEREQFEQANNSFQFPTTGRGFTKSRVDTYAAPLSLDLNLLGSHIDGVLRFSHIEPTVRQVARLVQNKSFRNTLRELDPTIAREMITPWLQRAATQRVVQPSDTALGKSMDSVATYLRRTVAMQIMMGNVKNALEQFGGLAVAAAKVKPRHIRSAMFGYVANRKAMTDEVVEKSDYMKTIFDTSIYQSYEAINEIISNPTVFEKIQTFSARHTYFLQAATQNVVNTIVWTAAYDQATEQGMDDAEAVRAADAAVRLTQGSNLPEDISAFESGTATKRLFTQFAGYFNMLANLNQTELQKVSRDIGLKKGAGRAFYLYLTGMMIPGAITLAVGEAMRGTLTDDDDDDGYMDDLLAKFFGQQGSTVTAMVPFVGQAVNAVAKGFNDNMYDDRLSLSPVVSTLETAVSVPSQVYVAMKGNLKSSKKITKDSLMLLGTVTGTPVGALSRQAGYLIDVAEEKAEPSGPVDFTRGLVSGSRGSKN